MLGFVGAMDLSHQKLSCLKSGASKSSAVSLPINQEYSTPLLRQLKFWCECSINDSDLTLYSNCITWLIIML